MRKNYDFINALFLLSCAINSNNENSSNKNELKVEKAEPVDPASGGNEVK